MDALERQAALEWARQGDVRALGDLLQSFQPYMRAIVRGFLDEGLQARIDDSDLVQNSFLEVQRSFADFRGGTVAEFAVWLRRTVIRSAGRTLRGLQAEKCDPHREQPAEDLAGLLADSGSSPSAQAIRQEQAARVLEALARLSADMQQVLLGRHVDGLPHAAIAQRLDRSEAAVRVLYVRALDRLRELHPDGTDSS
jgi:RNA polymerase sigma-70 factor (ECF subfamily)